MALDKRINAVRPDLAAASLKGHAQAKAFVEGWQRNVAVGCAPLRASPSDNAAQDSELLFGEDVTVYENKDGWAWVQAAKDHYVGYVRWESLADTMAATLRVSALMAPLFAAADLKSAVRDFLPMNAVVPVLARQGDYVNIGPGFLHQRHLLPQTEKDFVSIAERFIGVPYVWGGKTFAGLDCSGLIQTTLNACAIASPRDTDMMEKSLGAPVGQDDLSRGDLVFWKGHVGVMRDAALLLHANAFAMQVTSEPLAEARARIATPVTGVRRLNSPL